MGSVASAWLALTVHPVVGLAVAPFVGLALGYANGLVINLAARPFLSGDHRHRADLQRHCHRRVERSADFRADRCLHLVGREKVLGVFNAVWLMVIFALLLTFLLDRTTFGRRVLSVGGNEQAAILSGIRTDGSRSRRSRSWGLRRALRRSSSPRAWRWGRPARGGAGTADHRRGDPGRHSIYGGQGAVWRSLAGVFLLALVNNGFNILNIDPFFRDLTMG